jgi:hypothetical protein
LKSTNRGLDGITISIEYYAAIKNHANKKYLKEMG